MSEENSHLDALQDIRRMMQRSTRFISLSGLSGIAAGVCALVGAWFAYDWIHEYYVGYGQAGYTNAAFDRLKFSLLILAAVVLATSLVSAFYFTWRKADKDKLPLWDHTARNLALNMAIPLVTGGLFILAMLQYDEWKFVAPACLIFYGLALVNGSKYTLSEIRYLGLLEIALGLLNTQFIGYGLYFWAVGFGVLHIIYGFAMWWKYERNPAAANVR
ncbi:MAG: hypothetical protein JWP69_1401 [Flaviaesturariibacter sp.]|nr:hypothetical protein [Flaviaesturariibacter sp.]